MNTKTERNNGSHAKVKVIEEAQLVPCLEDGWEIIRELSDGRIVLRR